MNPADMIFFWARATPDHLAVIEPQMTIAYRAFAGAIESIAARLAQLIPAGNGTAAVAIDHPAKLLAVCAALLRSGIAAAPVGEEALSHLEGNDIRWIISSDDAPMPGGARTIRFDDGWLSGSSSVAPGLTAERTKAPTDTDLIFFVRGSTGVVKKMIMPAASLMDCANQLPITRHANFDRTLILPSLATPYGFMRALMQLYAGKTVCFAPGTKACLRLIGTHCVETVVASTQQALGLVEEVENGARHLLGSLKEIRIGRDVLSRDLARRIQSRLCRQVITEYGATEAGLIALANYDMIADVPNAVGFVLPDVDLEIVDETNAVVPLGEEGLVRCRTSYFARVIAANNPDRAQDAADTWCYSGDLGRLTPDGMLCIDGRADDAMLSGVAGEEVAQGSRPIGLA